MFSSAGFDGRLKDGNDSAVSHWLLAVGLELADQTLYHFKLLQNDSYISSCDDRQFFNDD